LQVLGDGPLGGVTVDARSSGQVRGFVKRPSALTWDPGLARQSRLAIGPAVGQRGVVVVIRDLGLAQNYSGQVAMESGEIDEEVERYLVASEQIDSLLRCDALVDSEGRIAAAAGLLVQTLPQAHGAAVVEFLRDTLAWPAIRSRPPPSPGPRSANVLRACRFSSSAPCASSVRARGSGPRPPWRCYPPPTCRRCCSKTARRR
jgi:redox-regulated HSP33 family molecular chaperone